MRSTKTAAVSGVILGHLQEIMSPEAPLTKHEAQQRCMVEDPMPTPKPSTRCGRNRTPRAIKDAASTDRERISSHNRNWVGALGSIGRCKIYVGPIEKAILAQEQAIRLSPRDPGIALWYFRIGEAYLLQSRIDEAIVWLEKARSANAGLPGFHAYLAAACALKGETERAVAELAEARRLGGEGSWSSITRFRANTRYEVPTIRALSEATLLAGLRKAGIPEE